MWSRARAIFPLISRTTERTQLLFSDADGNLLCLGSNKHDQLGLVEDENGRLVEDVSVSRPGKVCLLNSGSSVFVKVMALRKMTILLDKDGKACFIGSPTPREDIKRGSVLWYDFSKSIRVLDMEATITSSFFVTDEGLFAHKNEETGAPEPEIVVGLKDITTVACGLEHAVCLSKEGAVYVSGKNKFGELGLGDTEERREFVKLKYFDQQGLSVVSVNCGGQFSTFLVSNGNVYAAGRNSDGQLGLQDVTQRLTPVLVKWFPDQGLRISRVSCGVFHTIFADEKGTRYGCGVDSKRLINPNVDARAGTPIPLCLEWLQDGEVLYDAISNMSLTFFVTNFGVYSTSGVYREKRTSEGTPWLVRHVQVKSKSKPSEAISQELTEERASGNGRPEYSRNVNSGETEATVFPAAFCLLNSEVKGGTAGVSTCSGNESNFKPFPFPRDPDRAVLTDKKRDYIAMLWDLVHFLANKDSGFAKVARHMGVRETELEGSQGEEAAKFFLKLLERHDALGPDKVRHLRWSLYEVFKLRYESVDTYIKNHCTPAVPDGGDWENDSYDSLFEVPPTPHRGKIIQYGDDDVLIACYVMSTLLILFVFAKALI